METVLHDATTEQLEIAASAWAQRYASSLQPLGVHAAQATLRAFSNGYRRSLIVPEGETSSTSFEAKDPDARPQLLRENHRLLRSAHHELEAAVPYWKNLPAAPANSGAMRPRVLLMARMFLDVSGDVWEQHSWQKFVAAAEVNGSLLAREIWSFGSILKFALLERLMFHASVSADTHLQNSPGTPLSRMKCVLLSMERLGQVEWPKYLSGMIPFEAMLRKDSAGVYSKMDPATRNGYQNAVAQVARRSNLNELQVAETLIELAESAPIQGADERAHHIGYYLLGKGRPQLLRKAAYHPTLSERFKGLVQRHADEFYIGGILILTGILLESILLPHVSRYTSMTGVVFGMLCMVMPASQTATDVLNTFVQRLCPARPLPKMDFSKGVPVEHTTLVAIPTLLLSEKQVERLVEELEVRYLANRDTNIHFALLTDLPDSVSKPKEGDSHKLVDYTVSLIEGLNARYGVDGRGTFLLLHRHRIFNVRQGVWMGWERKRGKLLDLNRLIMGERDAFPVKSLVLKDIRSIRYVITLDSDTQLPRGAAQRLIGTMAHPLNRPVIDPRRRIVTEGYGILQPRVDVSVHSANQSRLAALQSGETGMDPYSRATSDVYQDLYGEAIFTGKGLYDVAVLHQILDKRFPRDALLSHDLIEGAYARVGLVSDVEVIDDYPSHYSAWTRRKHRWVRGDWQIAQWLFDRVPDEEGHFVDNPISNTSRWKILDNLRRSLVEICTFLLLLVGWYAIPGERLYWTLCTLALLFLPTYVQLFASLIPALWRRKPREIVSAFSGWLSSTVVVVLALAFLPSQVLISLDAIIRSTFRRFVTGNKLLEWETAAQAESNTSESTTDRYIRILPLLTLVLGALLILQSRKAIAIAGPILVLWAFTRLLMRWLNGKPSRGQFACTLPQIAFLRNIALRTWRYFDEFSTSGNHWLIPDNVQEGDRRQAERVSPTNAGLLLNARQAAVEFGYLTLSEFAELTARTLDAIEHMPMYKGHLFNWHHTQTLEVMDPKMVTTVDSGNFCASLLSLRMGALELLRRPMVSCDLEDGVRDHQEVLASLGATWPARMFPLPDDPEPLEALEHLVHLSITVNLRPEVSDDPDVVWWTGRIQARMRAVQDYVRTLMPWLLPEFAPLRRTVLKTLEQEMRSVTLTTALPFIDRIDGELQLACSRDSEKEGTNHELILKLRDLLVVARAENAALFTLLERIAERAQAILLAMDFTYLQSPERELLSIGYMPAEGALDSACFDLLASEARMAVFTAIAKGDIPQQTWFRMGRAHVRAYGRALLLSWTGTMFEYLMPTLWMESYPNTMIQRSLTAVVDVQRAFAKSPRIPWGISESGYSQADAAGNYLYHAFGIPAVALKYGAEAGPVVSPYSTCLALQFSTELALRNLRYMQKHGWLRSYGFYEAIDYSTSSASRRSPAPVPVRSWMAHHQGMSLLAICNLLKNRVFQRFFHAAPMVRATERLLHERPQHLVEEL